MANAQTLRDYQERGLQMVLDAYRSGARSVLMVLATGGGKTTVFSHLIAQLDRAGRRSLLLVHRRELASQAVNRLREFGVQHGVVMAGEPAHPYFRVQVASVQTAVRRERMMPQPPGLIVCDEAHLSTAASWQGVLERYPSARILGVTATPWRLSGKPLAGLYDSVVVVATPAELREQGHLSRYVGFAYRSPDLSGVKTAGGDYNDRQSAEAMSGSAIVDNIVEKWGQHASELSTVVFAVTVEHSKALAEKFRAAGARAEHLDGTTPHEQRQAILRRVETGQTQVLCNVGVAVEGLDIPRLKCCVLARPTKSVSRAIQMMGRVRRPWEGVTARIHDHAFIIPQHGLPDSERDYQLVAKPDKPPSLSTCPECLALFSGPECPACNFVPAPVVGEPTGPTMLDDADEFGFESGREHEVVTETAPVQVRWQNPGRVVEGRYTQRVEEPTPYGPNWSYLIAGPKRRWWIPGTTRLNALMGRVSVGSLVRVTYTEDTPLAGDRFRREFKVEVDDGE